MVSTSYILIPISLLLGIFAIDYLRSYDIYEKEPLNKMVLVTLCGGIISIGISTVLYAFIKENGIGITRNFWSAILIIGPVEEAAKAIALMSSYIFIKNELNEPTDGLIYMSCVALGFSLIENYYYATHSLNSGYLIFFRLLISTPAHIFFSIFMGLSIYSLIKLKKGIFLFLISYIYACTVHGLYNSIIFHGWMLIFLLLVIRLSYSWGWSLLTYTTAKSPFRKTIKEFIDNYQDAEIESGLECISCGSKNSKITYHFGKSLFQKCDKCSYYIASKTGLFEIFRYFGSPFISLDMHFWDAKFYKKEYSVLFKDNCISDDTNLSFFNLDKINDALIEFNSRIINKFESYWWYPSNKNKSEIVNSNSVSPKSTARSDVNFIKSLTISLLLTVLLVALIAFKLKTAENITVFLILGLPFVVIVFGLFYSIISILTKK